MEKKRKKNRHIGRVPADSNLWSEKSKHSYSFGISEYKDIVYNCWHCGKRAVFSAEDQKYTFEKRKAHICQQRVLCHDCWKESLKIAADIAEKESQWKKMKSTLKSNRAFLQEWLELLERQERYIRYKPNTAIKNMLKKTLTNF